MDLTKKTGIILLALLLISLISGLIWCGFRFRDTIPSLNGDAYSILATDQGVFMVLSDRENNCLVRVSEEGELLNFCRTGRSEAFQYLECEGNTVYAIRNAYQNRRLRQSVVSLSLTQLSMRPKLLYDLSAYPDIRWKELYPSYLGEKDQLIMVGIDSDKQTWLLRYDLLTAEAETERVLPGVRAYQVKYVGPGWYVFIDEMGRLGQYREGRTQTNLLRGVADTPMHISTCGTRCFVSDSVTGSIYELHPDGSVSLYRNGGDPVGTDGFTYGSLKLFTTRDRGGEIRVLGLGLGSENVVVEEGREPIHQIQAGPKAGLLLFGRSFFLWWAGGFLALGALFLLFRQIVVSRRVLLRIVLSASLVTAGLLGGLIGIQRNAFLESLKSEALNKFRLISGNMIEAVNDREPSVEWPDRDAIYIKRLGAEVREQYELLQTKIGDGESGTENVSISLLYFQGGRPYVYYDQTIPWGYEVADMKKREYVAALENALAADLPVPFAVRGDTMDELLYAETFLDAGSGRKGCIVIEQPVADATAAISDLDASMRIYLLLGPLLLSVLSLIYWRFLLPLKGIKEAMDEFYESGSGNQIYLGDSMVKDEFYDISRTFNKLSVDTRVQMNQLGTINAAYARFVPEGVLKILGKSNILEVHPGDNARVTLGILVAAPGGSGLEEADAARYLTLWGREIAKEKGMITDYDEGTGAVTAIFPDGTDSAWRCAEGCWQALSREKLRGRLMIHGATVLYGVWGTEELLHPLAVSGDISRLIGALPALEAIGGGVTACGKAAEGRGELRPLGYLTGKQGLLFWEAYRYEKPGIARRRRKTLEIFCQGLTLFQEGRFEEGKARFAKVLREDPTDGAAKWYLFRCEELGQLSKR